MTFLLAIVNIEARNYRSVIGGHWWDSYRPSNRQTKNRPFVLKVLLAHAPVNITYVNAYRCHISLYIIIFFIEIWSL